MMKAEDVKNNLDRALDKTDLTKINPPKLLSDNGSCYISNELADYLQEKDMKHVRGRPLHPQTQGKIERYHESIQNLTPAEVYYGRGERKLKKRKNIKNKTLNARKKQYQKNQLTLN